MKWSLLTIAAMLALGFSTRYAGLDTTMGLAFASTGVLFPFFSPLLGWLEVAPPSWPVPPTEAAGNKLMRLLLSHSAAVLWATVIVGPARWLASAPHVAVRLGESLLGVYRSGNPKVVKA